MHAILGMAASHLELTTGEDLNAVAINHRVLAIKGSNQAISQKRRSGHDGDALLGACYALTFQASYMKDGLIEYFQMMRGCELLQNQLRLEKVPLAFLMEEKHTINFLKTNMQGLPIIEAHLTEAAYRSLHILPAILEGSGHLKVHGLLLGIIDSTKYSSLKGNSLFSSRRIPLTDLKKPMSSSYNSTSCSLKCKGISLPKSSTPPTMLGVASSPTSWRYIFC